MKPNKNNITFEGSLPFLLKDAGERAEKMAKLLMVPRNMREEFIGSYVSEFINGLSASIQTLQLVESRGQTPSYEKCVEDIKGIAEKIGFSSVPSGEGSKELDAAIEEMEVRLPEAIKQFLGSLPEEARGYAEEAIQGMVSNGMDPEDISITHIHRSVDPSRN